MVPTSPVTTLRDILQDQLSKAAADLAPIMEARVKESAAEARERSRAETADALNQAARRLRMASDFTEVAGALLDASGAYCNGAALLRVLGDRVKGERIRGVGIQAAERFQALEIPLAQAAALSGAVESADQVVALSTASQVSPALLEIAGDGDDTRIFIFPLIRTNRVQALLYCWGEVQGPPLELLAQVAGLCLPGESPLPAPVASDLVQIGPGASTSGAVETMSEPAPARTDDWSALPAEEQRAHLRAQRFARVQVSEMRLFQAEAVVAGRLHRDLYSALQDSIDSAREKFRRNFVATCPSMVDYLHQELVRTLANDNPKLLGAGYPGAIV
jgi:hypothetical protein